MDARAFEEDEEAERKLEEKRRIEEHAARISRFIVDRQPPARVMRLPERFTPARINAVDGLSLRETVEAGLLVQAVDNAIDVNISLDQDAKE